MHVMSNTKVSDTHQKWNNWWQIYMLLIDVYINNHNKCIKLMWPRINETIVHLFPHFSFHTYFVLLTILETHICAPLYFCCEEYRSQTQSQSTWARGHGSNVSLSCGISSPLCLRQQTPPCTNTYTHTHTHANTHTHNNTLTHTQTQTYR